MEIVKKVAVILTIIGALNWGLIGFFDFNLVAFLFGPASFLSQLTYMLVGIAAILVIVSYPCCGIKQNISK